MTYVASSVGKTAPFSIFFLRHGETTLNVEGRKQGSAGDSPLTQRGEDQALQMARFLYGKVARIYCSPLGRARRTAEIIAEALHGFPVIICDALREMDFGLITGITTEEAEKKYPSFFEQRKCDKAYTHFPGGESYADIETRLREPLLSIYKSESASFAIVGHESTNRIARGILEGLSLDEAVTLHQSHDAIVEYIPSKGIEIIHQLPL